MAETCEPTQKCCHVSTWTSSCSSLLTFSRPPMSSQVMFGVSTTVSRSADGLLFPIANFKKLNHKSLLFRHFLYFSLFVRHTRNLLREPCFQSLGKSHLCKLQKETTLSVSCKSEMELEPGSCPWWRRGNWGPRRQWCHPQDQSIPSSLWSVEGPLHYITTPSQLPHTHGSRSLSAISKNSI